MAEAKHSLGPLQVLDHPQDGVFVLDAGTRTLAKVVYLLDPAERMANAHLFAAAPEQHELLSTFTEWARQVAAREDVPQGIRSAAAGLAQDGRRLIAKATGSQHE